MGRGGIKKKAARFRVGDIVRAHNSGPGKWHLYRNTSQMVKIRRTPRHTGDSYIADLVDFEGPASVNLEYEECNLTAENDYIVGEENLR